MVVVKRLILALFLVYCLLAVVEGKKNKGSKGSSKKKGIPYQKQYGESCERPTDCNVYKILDCNMQIKKCVCMFSIHVWDEEKGCYYPFDTSPPTDETKPIKTTKKPKPKLPTNPGGNSWFPTFPGGGDFGQITQDFINQMMTQVNQNIPQFGNWTKYTGTDWWKQFFQFELPPVPKNETEEQKKDRLQWLVAKGFEVGIGIWVGGGFEIGGGDNKCPCIPGWNDNKGTKRLNIKKQSILL